MNQKISKIILGLLLGLAIPMFLYSLLAEHLGLFFVFPIVPILGMLIGFGLGIFGLLPNIRIWKSVLIFAIIISFATGVIKTRSAMLKHRRDQIANPIKEVIGQLGSLDYKSKYSAGNGFDLYPKIEFSVESNISYETLISTLDEKLRQDGWVMTNDYTSPSWMKNAKTTIGAYKTHDNLSDSLYTIRITFKDRWIHELLNNSKDSR